LSATNDGRDAHGAEHHGDFFPSLKVVHPVTVIAVVGAIAAAIGLGCTIACGIDMFREWAKRGKVLPF